MSRITDRLRADLRARYGTAVAVEKGVPIRSRAVVGDTSPFYGGTEVGYKDVDLGFLITPIYACTTGFAWRPPNGAQVLLTAGHCVPRNGPAPFAYTDRENWDERMGAAGSSIRVEGAGAVPYNGAYRGDIGFINITAGKSAAAVVHTSASEAPSVGGAVGPSQGLSYCHHGITAGRLCGWVVQSTNTSYRDLISGTVVRNEPFPVAGLEGSGDTPMVWGWWGWGAGPR